MVAIKQYREKNSSGCILRFESAPISCPSGCITGLRENPLTGTDWWFHHDPVTKSCRYTVQIDFPTRRLPPGCSVTSVGHVHTVICSYTVDLMRLFKLRIRIQRLQGQQGVSGVFLQHHGQWKAPDRAVRSAVTPAAAAQRRRWRDTSLAYQLLINNHSY